MLKKEDSITQRIHGLLPWSEDSGLYKEEIILLGYRGSISHGTYQKTGLDDKDFIGIVIPPDDYIFGLKRFDQMQKMDGDIDIVIYELRKYFYLLLKANPNVLELLWLEPHHYVYVSPIGQLLIDNRDLFISKLCYKTYGGYAYSQLRKMDNYDTNGKMGDKRKQLVEKWGFDVKNSSHLIRLLKMGIEILMDGEINVYRGETDSQLYISIKNGEWSLEKVKKEADRLFALLDEAYIKSELPKKPDFEKVNGLCMRIMQEWCSI